MVLSAMCQEPKKKTDCVCVCVCILSHKIMKIVKHSTCQISEHEDRPTEIPWSLSTHTHSAP